ncbi:hypothetical protein LLH06_06860 [Mucilaginibacter daejeonensis]|uniref:hypothetical protein n=1 Tax=Mucilaginibacter daejeonensis TaxID=398049 RepID=UPI001D16FBD0|nr:hypothetical protein [Mucilaginibacter daejeonensis]UEG54680.1 hypothetical protein LLH06_06860 [Mucilaginibacter daejeonensis]
MNNERSPHILNASSNLLGICFVVLTSLKFLDLAARSVIDELVAIAIVFFMASCILSFLSIRGSIKVGSRYERVADVMFIGGLIILFATALLFLFDFIN